MNQPEVVEKDEVKQEQDSLEFQLFRMQENMKKIAKKNEIISIDQTNKGQWVIIYSHKWKNKFQIMLHDCSSPYRGKWDGAIEATYKDQHTLHIADIKGEKNKGYGSVLMKYIKEIAEEANVQSITGDIAKRDFDHMERLKHFYWKHDFDMKIDYEEQFGEIVW
ncbi:hypothetical protein [Virgibacillus saliphilus]|uniref:hypothetical protein n=1 Tax=Virgibacillus saliphilus TaxID=2831674 RepID=UPI002105E7D1|nr:hypothetical protein [Virgibacillus sp. NKC19-3]